MKNHVVNLVSVCKLLMFALLILGSMNWVAAQSTPQAGDVGTNLRELLQVYDESLVTDYHLKLQVRMPTQMVVEQGMSTSTVEMSGDAEQQTLKLVRNAIDPVLFEQDTKLGGYDQAGNFLLGYDAGMSISLTGEAWKVRCDQRVVSVDSHNAPARPVLDAAPRIDIYEANNHDAANLYYRYLLALGRGYGQLITQITSVEEVEGGILRVTANGSLFSRYGGEWILSVDTQHDYLVREASFRRAGEAVPGFTAHSQGTTQSGAVALAAFGDAAFSDYPINVRVLDYAAGPNKELIKIVARQVNDTTDFPKGTQLMDFTRVNGDGIPRMTHVER